MIESAKMDNTVLTRDGCHCISPIQLLKEHYSSTTYHRTEAEIEREKYLIPRFIPFNRWFLIPAAVIIQFCCGSLYAWSVYNIPIERYMYGESSNTASITFYMAIGALGVSAALFGPWLERNGPSKAAFLGTCGFLLGHLLAALAVYVKQMWLLYLGYGIVGGCSIGICYISPVSALQKYFPDRRGLASGAAVCGFGAGSIAASPLQTLLMDSVGIPLTFVILGGAYFILMLFACATLRAPPPGYTVRGLTVEGVKVAHAETKENTSDIYGRPLVLKLTLWQSLKTRDFWLMFCMFFGNLVTGLVILSRLADMIIMIFEKSKTNASLVVSVNGGCNVAGRLLFSLLSDKIGRKTVFLISLFTQATIIACMNPILLNKQDSYWAFVILIWILSSCYGCSNGVIPAFLADMFGASNIGACHGVILFGWSMASIGGGLLYTAIFNWLVPHFYTSADAYPYLVNFGWLLAIVIIAFTLTSFIRTNPWHRLLAAIDNKRVFYFSFGQKLLRIDLKIMKKDEIIDACEEKGGIEAFNKHGKKLKHVQEPITEMEIVHKV